MPPVSGTGDRSSVERSRTSATPERALAIYAHPDDAEVACAGTLAGWARGGAEVHVVCVCRGEKGAATLVDADALAGTRARESKAAAAILGVASWSTLGRNDGEVEDDDALRAELVALIRRVRPQVVIGGDPTAVFFGSGYFNHRDHRVVGWAVLDAVSPGAASPNYFPNAGPAHRVNEVLLTGSLEPDHWIDISDTLEDKVASLLCHESQLGDGTELGADGALVAEMVADRAADVGRAVGASHAEGFRRLLLT